MRKSKLRAEQRAGRFLMSALGTPIEGGPLATLPDSFNTANTNALEHAGRVLALWEGGSAHALSPADLATAGPVTWGPGLQQVPFSAHPKIDASGTLWNIGTQGKAIVVWQIDAAGRPVRTQVGESPLPGGMVHDMAVTERYIVMPLPPVRFNFNQPAGDGPRRFALQPGEPLRVLVMAKADIAQRRVFERPAQMVFHIGNAHETGDGRIVLSYIGAPDAGFLDRGAVALMAGQPARAGAAALQIATLDMASGRVQEHAIAGEAEFPRVHPQRIGLPARWLLMGAAWAADASRTQHALLHGVQLADTQTGRAWRHEYGEHQVAEEHVFVPKPGKLDAWLLGTTFDARRQATVLNLLDAAQTPKTSSRRCTCRRAAGPPTCPARRSGRWAARR